MVGEKPGEEGASLCSGGWLMGLEDGGCKARGGGEVCCFTGGGRAAGRLGVEADMPLVYGENFGVFS